MKCLQLLGQGVKFQGGRCEGLNHSLEILQKIQGCLRYEKEGSGLYKIRLYGDPILRQKAKKVEVIDDNLDEILEKMIETMYLGDGVGLAAPQVGLSLRMFVMDYGEGPIKVVNPEILHMTQETEVDEEGCLSLPDIFENVERARFVKVKYQNEKGEWVEKEFEGYPARIFQHEYDHLDGILFIDRISPAKRALLKPKLLELMKKSKQMAKR